MRWGYFTVFAVCMTIFTYFACSYFNDLSGALKELREIKNENEVKNLELKLADLRTELAGLKSETALLRAAQTRALEFVSETNNAVLQLAQKLENIQPRQGQFRPEGEPWMQVVAESQMITMKLFERLGELARQRQRDFGQFWPDGAMEFGNLFGMANDFDMPYRYFASPDKKKFTIVVMPVHRNLKRELGDKYPVYAMAYTSDGGFYIAKRPGVDAPEKYAIKNWEKEHNLPEGPEWIDARKALEERQQMRPEGGDRQMPMRPEGENRPMPMRDM